MQQDAIEIENEIVERGVWYAVNEESRMYYFPNGGMYAVRNPRRLKVSERGTHYVIDMNDIRHIINHTWMAIEAVE